VGARTETKRTADKSPDLATDGDGDANRGAGYDMADDVRHDLLAYDMGAPHLDAPIRPITGGEDTAVKSVRAFLCAVLVTGMPVLAGCMTTLGLQSDGTYILESHEEQASCDVLYKDIWGRIQLIKTLPAKAIAEQATPPPTASRLFGRWFDTSSKGLKAVAEFDRERAHVYALQRTMREKKCVNVDVDLEIAEATAEMARIRQN
jgi:hypothetical protein